jgi:hypothetical protein
MKRFNLILVTKDASLRPEALKALSKTFKNNFIFEVPTLEDAKVILSKLHIDILLLDLDHARIDVVELNKRFPTVSMMGVSARQGHIESHIDVYRHRVFEKRDFALAFAAEVKTLSKKLDTPNHPFQRVAKQAPADPTDFVDFVALTRAN